MVNRSEPAFSIGLMLLRPSRCGKSTTGTQEPMTKDEERKIDKMRFRSPRKAELKSLQSIETLLARQMHEVVSKPPVRANYSPLSSGNTSGQPVKLAVEEDLNDTMLLDMALKQLKQAGATINRQYL